MKSLDDIKRLIHSQGSAGAGETIKKAALGGSLVCQKFLSQAGLFIPLKDRPEHVRRDTELFTRLAAEAGDSESQFNLAKLYIDEVDADCEYWSEEDLDRIAKAKRWHREAAAKGFRPSIQSLKNLESFPESASQKSSMPAYDKGRELFEQGMAAASAYDSERAIELYTESFELAKNPAPLINRAKLYKFKIRYEDAVKDLLAARYLDETQGNDFRREIESELSDCLTMIKVSRSEPFVELFRGITADESSKAADNLIMVAFGADDKLMEFHFFNELDNVIKFEKIEDYPEAAEYINENGGYGREFIALKVAIRPNEQRYLQAERVIRAGLTHLGLEDRFYVRRSMMYRIHTMLMARDYGDFWASLSSDSGCQDITREAVVFRSV